MPAVWLMGCLATAAASLLVAPAAPDYDPWMWLLWGRELAAGGLDTAEGPAFKPLPVAVGALLAPLGDGAPAAWLLLARSASLAGVGLAGLLAWRLVRDPPHTGPGTGASPSATGASASGAAATATAPLVGAVVAVLGVLLTEPLLPVAARGGAEGPFLAAALGAALAVRSGRPGWALAGGVAGALLRVEAWPFLLLGSVWLWRARPRWRPALAGLAVAVPAAWFVPDLLASGELWRSADRARVANPGQPALAQRPALASLLGAAGLGLVPVVLGVLGLVLRPARQRFALALAGSGLAWLALVALMAELGFSGEARYALPGVGVLSVAGAAGLAAVWRHHPRMRFLLGVAVLLAAAPRLAGLPGAHASLEAGRASAAALERAVALGGGPARLLGCGGPVVGPYRGPLLAYRLGIPKRRVAFAPGRSGVLFVSSSHGDLRPTPPVPPGYEAVARAGGWRVLVRCAGPDRHPGRG